MKSNQDGWLVGFVLRAAVQDLFGYKTPDLIMNHVHGRQRELAYLLFGGNNVDRQKQLKNEVILYRIVYTGVG